MKEISAYVLKFKLTSANMQDVKKLGKLRLEHFESYSSFSYCAHSSVYQAFWPSGWVTDCFTLILFRHKLADQDVQSFSTLL